MQADRESNRVPRCRFCGKQFEDTGIACCDEAFQAWIRASAPPEEPPAACAHCGVPLPRGFFSLRYAVEGAEVCQGCYETKSVSWDTPAVGTLLADLQAINALVAEHAVPLDHGHDPEKFSAMRRASWIEAEHREDSLGAEPQR